MSDSSDDNRPRNVPVVIKIPHWINDEPHHPTSFETGTDWQVQVRHIDNDPRTKEHCTKHLSSEEKAKIHKYCFVFNNGRQDYYVYMTRHEEALVYKDGLDGRLALLQRDGRRADKDVVVRTADTSDTNKWQRCSVRTSRGPKKELITNYKDYEVRDRKSPPSGNEDSDNAAQSSQGAQQPQRPDRDIEGDKDKFPREKGWTPLQDAKITGTITNATPTIEISVRLPSYMYA
ncbi:MAG: hypothetical protein Q9162_005404 [Coniocarpon cinnabarinum]